MWQTAANSWVCDLNKSKWNNVGRINFVNAPFIVKYRLSQIVPWFRLRPTYTLILFIFYSVVYLEKGIKNKNYPWFWISMLHLCYIWGCVYCSLYVILYHCGIVLYGRLGLGILLTLRIAIVSRHSRSCVSRISSPWSHLQNCNQNGLSFQHKLFSL